MGGFLQGGDLAGAVVADASGALSLDQQQQQLFMAQHQQQQLLFMQRHQELLAEHGMQGQAASGSHSVTMAGIDQQAPAPPEVAELPAGLGGRTRRARRRRAPVADASEDGEAGGSGSEGETPKRQRRCVGSMGRVAGCCCLFAGKGRQGVRQPRHPRDCSCLLCPCRRTRPQRSEGGERKESSSRFRGVTKHRRSGRFEVGSSRAAVASFGLEHALLTSPTGFWGGNPHMIYNKNRPHS